MHRNKLPILKQLQDILRFSTKDESARHLVSHYTLPMRRGSKKDKIIKKIYRHLMKRLCDIEDLT